MRSSNSHTPVSRPPKLLDQLAAKVRLLHYSKRTEQAYVDWVRRFILFHNKRHPGELGAAELELFLTDLAMRASPDTALRWRSGSEGPGVGGVGALQRVNHERSCERRLRFRQ